MERIAIEGDPICGVIQAEIFQQLTRFRDNVGLVQMVEESDHAQILKTRQVFVNGGVLAREADVVRNADPEEIFRMLDR